MTDELQARFSKLFSDTATRIKTDQDKDKAKKDAAETSRINSLSMWNNILANVVKPTIEEVGKVIKNQDGYIEHSSTQQGYTISVRFVKLVVTGPMF